jgi:antirestriction protein ArdC
MKTLSKAHYEDSTNSNSHKVGKSYTKQSVSDIITELIIGKLEAGIIPWKKPWNGSANAPKNLISGKEYRGLNAFILGCYGFSSCYFATFKQVQDKKGTIKKGAKSIPVIFYSVKEVEDRLTGSDINIPVLRYFRVFSLDDIEGIPAPIQATITREFSPIEEAQNIIKNMPYCPEIKSGGNKAFYSPSLDYINLPPENCFHSNEEFYSTMFHELTHSTGHANRLNRSTVTKTAHFGSSEYSNEELIAEMGASFLNATAGIIDNVIDNSTAYIKGWISALKSSDNRGLVIKAASQAQKATDYILGVPAYSAE